jgi:hypothetical protein
MITNRFTLEQMVMALAPSRGRGADGRGLPQAWGQRLSRGRDVGSSL